VDGDCCCCILSLTRSEPIIVRVPSNINEELELESLVLIDIGLSASRSRLFDNGGLEFILGRGESPMNASSYNISP
jgi:hypothetical protein